jgi:hypothetical protein
MELSEIQVRALRDKVYSKPSSEVYSKPSSDKNWDGCKEAWMQPSEVLWLQKMEQRAKDLKVLKVNTV